MSAAKPITQQKAPLRPFVGENIPAELRALPRWAPWRAQWNEKRGERGKWDKIPCHPNGYGLSTAKPDRWVSFEAAMAAFQAHPEKFAGIGYCLTGPHERVGIDLDNCVRADGTIEPWAQEIVDTFASYTEISPSGRGLRIFVLATIASDWNNHAAGQGAQDGEPGGIEVYGGHAPRFLTVTGEALPGRTTLREAPAGVLEGLAARYASAKPTAAVVSLQMPELLLEEDLPDLDSLGLPCEAREFLAEGEHDGDRSAVLLMTARALCSAGLDEAEVLSVLAANPHAMEVALDHRRQDPDRALAYLWKEHAQKAKVWAASRVATADDFDDVSEPGAAPRSDWRHFFEPVSMADLGNEPPLEWFWDGYLPGGEVTMLAADGGVGKSFLALALAVSIAAGLEFLGKLTQKAPVLFVSAEDDARTLRRRLRTVLDALGLDEAPEGLHLVDSTARPELYAFNQTGREGRPTKALPALKEALAATSARVLMVDNASNTFAADENARAQASAFVRALKALVLPSGGAVLLLAHVDKNTSRAGALATAAYSGSTAWHNAVRSRIYLVKTEKRGLELQHHKSTHGVELPPLALQRLTGGPLALAEAQAAPARDPADFLPLLYAVAEFNHRGEWISPYINAKNNAGKLLAPELGCTAPAVLSMCREAQRAGLLAVVNYRNQYRKQAERWALTPAGEKEAAGWDLA